MNCCATEPTCQTRETTAPEQERCYSCDEHSRPVSRKTVLLMLKPHLLEYALTGNFSFCPERDCPTVYFEDYGNRIFTKDDLRVVVGVKASFDPIPVCYCFGFDESHLREEISRSGKTTIPEQISRLTREGLCACDTRNPSGVCCLGEVNKVAKRLVKEMKER